MFNLDSFIRIRLYFVIFWTREIFSSLVLVLCCAIIIFYLISNFFFNTTFFLKL
jgi:hypothetical protein